MNKKTTTLLYFKNSVFKLKSVVIRRKCHNKHARGRMCAIIIFINYNAIMILDVIVHFGNEERSSNTL